MIFFGQAKDGKLILDHQDKYSMFLSSLDGRVVLNLKKYRKPRSLRQNNLYWLWLTAIADYTGYDTEELHASFKAMFLVDRSKQIPLVRSTTVLNSQEFTQYLDKISQVAAELNITLPDPNEAYNISEVDNSKDSA